MTPAAGLRGHLGRRARSQPLFGPRFGWAAGSERLAYDAQATPEDAEVLSTAMGPLDGRQLAIAYVPDDPTGSNFLGVGASLFVVNADGTGLRLVHPYVGGIPAWRPN